MWPVVLQQQLPRLTPQSLPTDTDGVLALRDALWRLRSFLDVFWFAFSCDASTRDDSLSALRSVLDDGYTVIGNFKDLKAMGVVYSHTELALRRSDCLDWKASFIEDDLQRNYTTYLSNFMSTSSAVVSCRGRDSPSAQFWGALSEDLWPTADTPLNTAASALRWLVRLQDGVTVKLIVDLASLRAMNVSDMLMSADQHQRMHDYRKLLRTEVWLPTRLFSLALFYIAEPEAQKLMNVCSQFMTLLETLNNALNAWEFDNQHYADTTLSHQQALDAWNAVQTFLAKNDMVVVFTQLHTMLDTSGSVLGP